MRSWAVAVVAGFVGFATQAPAQSAGDPAKGQRVFNQQCRACHTLEKGGASPTGPNLHGVFGRKAGTAEGYEFSDAMKASGVVWDDATMADYNRDPKGKVPGTKMVFTGIKQAGQLDDLVIYLKQATQ
jgi:cytochrome c